MNSVISLEKFLKMYLGISNRNLSKLTHKDVKEIFPFLKRTSFDYANENLSEIGSGDIILVKDSKNNIVPYIKPEFVIEDINEVNIEVKDKNSKTYHIDNITDLSNYELKKLTSTRNSTYKVARQVKKELKQRGIVKTKKREEKRRKDDFDDQY